METHVPHPKLRVRTPQLRAPILAQSERGMAAADGMLPEVVQLGGRSRQVTAEMRGLAHGLTAPGAEFDREAGVPPILYTRSTIQASKLPRPRPASLMR